jgi:hypothetical protein
LASDTGLVGTLASDTGLVGTLASDTGLVGTLAGVAGVAGSPADGDPHLVAAVLHNLAGLAHVEGRFAAAEAPARAALALHERLDGPGSSTAAADTAVLGAVLPGMGRFEESEAALVRAMTIWLRHAGPGHHEVAGCLHTWASCTTCAAAPRRWHAGASRRPGACHALRRCACSGGRCGSSRRCWGPRITRPVRCGASSAAPGAAAGARGDQQSTRRAEPGFRDPGRRDPRRRARGAAPVHAACGCQVTTAEGA